MSLTVDTFDHTGKKTTATKLSKEVFDAAQHPFLMSQALRVFIDHQHQNTNRSKRRGEINLTKAKAWRQKGTGKARHGARSAPIFVGGGKAHGPVPTKHMPLKLTKKMRKKAILGALTEKQTENVINIIENPDKIKSKTKDLNVVINKIIEKSTKTLMIIEKPHQNLIQAAKNIPSLNITQASRVNLYEILNAKNILISKSSLKILKDLFTQS